MWLFDKHIFFWNRRNSRSSNGVKTLIYSATRYAVAGSNPQLFFYFCPIGRLVIKSVGLSVKFSIKVGKLQFHDPIGDLSIPQRCTAVST